MAGATETQVRTYDVDISWTYHRHMVWTEWYGTFQSGLNTTSTNSWPCENGRTLHLYTWVVPNNIKYSQIFKIFTWFSNRKFNVHLKYRMVLIHNSSHSQRYNHYILGHIQKYFMRIKKMFYVRVHQVLNYWVEKFSSRPL